VTDRRKSKIKQPDTRPLFLVAGLPKSTAGAVGGIVKSQFGKPCEVIALAAPTSDHYLYDRDYVRKLAILGAQFAQRRRAIKSKIEVSVPSFVYLLYVPGAGEERLLAEFDFAVFPIALSELGLRDARGRMNRHEVEAITASVRRAMLQQREAISEISNRIKLARTKDAILLPPINFHISRAERFSQILLAVRQGHRNWNDRFAELATRRFDRETLSALKAGEVQYCFCDARDIVFFLPWGLHGDLWEGEVSAETASSILRALYRFGGPLPRGFHHDAQFERPRILKNEVFECSSQGRVQVSGTHANIYPNDYVRAKK
jgi:hypothetical protein